MLDIGKVDIQDLNRKPLTRQQSAPVYNVPNRHHSKVHRHYSATREFRKNEATSPTPVAVNDGGQNNPTKKTWSSIKDNARKLSKPNNTVRIPPSKEKTSLKRSNSVSDLATMFQNLDSNPPRTAAITAEVVMSEIKNMQIAQQLPKSRILDKSSLTLGLEKNKMSHETNQSYQLESITNGVNYASNEQKSVSKTITPTASISEQISVGKESPPNKIKAIQSFDTNKSSDIHHAREVEISKESEESSSDSEISPDDSAHFTPPTVEPEPEEDLHVISLSPVPVAPPAAPPPAVPSDCSRDTTDDELPVVRERVSLTPPREVASPEPSPASSPSIVSLLSPKPYQPSPYSPSLWSYPTSVSLGSPGNDASGASDASGANDASENDASDGGLDAAALTRRIIHGARKGSSAANLKKRSVGGASLPAYSPFSPERT